MSERALPVQPLPSAPPELPDGEALQAPGGDVPESIEPPDRPPVAHPPAVPESFAGAASGEDTALPPPPPPPAALLVVPVDDLDWDAIREKAMAAPDIRNRMRGIVEGMESLLDHPAGPQLLFDDCRSGPNDRALQIPQALIDDTAGALWIVGDLHGDLLALEASLALIERIQRAEQERGAGIPPRIVFLGDFFDDEGLGLETVLRIFELILERPGHIGLVVGNHDEALAFRGGRFTSSVSPSDFADLLNEHAAHEWMERTGKLMVRLAALASRALFLADGLLVAHGGFPLRDLHEKLRSDGDWNDPMCLSDFVWGRAHPKARRKMPNRFSRGSQFGYEDFSDFCALATALGRPVTHMVRGHDHPEDRVELYPAYHAHPMLTTVALSRRLPRERFGPYERFPSVCRVVPGSLPQPFQLRIPPELVRAVFPPPAEGDLQAEALR